MFRTRKSLFMLFLIAAAAASLFYFEFPWAAMRPVFYKDIINVYSAEYNIDPLLVTSVIKAESNFSKKARSSTGATGLMQLMPATAEEIAKDLGYKGFKASDLENPDINIRFGVYYLAELKAEFGGSNILALAAYNAGRSKVQSWRKLNPMIEAEIADIPYGETREYVKSVIGTYNWLKWTQNLRNLIRKKTP